METEQLHPDIIIEHLHRSYETLTAAAATAIIGIVLMGKPPSPRKG